MALKILFAVFGVFLLVMIIFSVTSFRRMVKVYHKFDKEFVYCGLTGLEFASLMIEKFNLSTKVFLTDKELSECYFPKKNIVCISEHTAETSSVSSICVTAHEFGHAVQKKTKSKLFIFQEILIFITKICAFLLPFLIIGGIVLIFIEQYHDIALKLWLGALISVFMMFLLKIFTVPMEAEASKIAYNFLKENNILSIDELKHGKKVLNAAIGTYVASIFMPIVKFFKLLGRAFRR